MVPPHFSVRCPTVALITVTIALLLTMLLVSPSAAQLPASDVTDPYVDENGAPICSGELLPIVLEPVTEPDPDNPGQQRTVTEPDPDNPGQRRTVTRETRPNRSELCSGGVYTTMPPGIDEPQKPIPMVQRKVPTAYVEATDTTPATVTTTTQTVPDLFAINKAWEAYIAAINAREAAREAYENYQTYKADPTDESLPADYTQPTEPPEKPTPYEIHQTIAVDEGDDVEQSYTYNSSYDETPDENYVASGGNTTPTSTSTYSTSPSTKTVTVLGTDPDGTEVEEEIEVASVTATVTPVMVTRNTDLTAREEANKSCTNNCEKAGDKGVPYPAIFKPDNWLENADEFFAAYDAMEEQNQPFYTCEYMYPDSKPEEYSCYLQTPGS